MVRVIEYRLAGVAGAEPIYRLITSLLDRESAPALELAAPYGQRWEIETALDKLETPLRGGGLESCCAARPRSWCCKLSIAC